MARRFAYRGFSLVELLVVLAIISSLVMLLLPAVQQARESARRTTCINNLHNQAVALANYHAGRQRLPPGRNSGRFSSEQPILGFSWAAYLLPYLEQEPLQRAINYDVAWNNAINKGVVATRLPIFQCPSSEEVLVGESDYGGINGTAIITRPDGPESDDPELGGSELGLEVLPQIFNRGVLIPGRSLKDGITFGQVTDGLSNTLAIAESPILSPDQDRYWASGTICISHDYGSVNSQKRGIFSEHPGGACTARVDQSVSFLMQDVSEYVIAALCTRAAGD